ncbi:putative transposase InsQ for insertion sequence element IS609 [Clostridium pasteurianum DSM 525 = ATCC 6013]|uniref:Putative transposase InsQ for insertion sequence element IS609 n=1 Tax=Clostridium pasteurianum DSM 525 = ATCC 6013 TaxID=1262449 RepID=A0A0H3J9F4_CLOPA|nr:RNA-guided endonuclease TnpB family protein [Clostridium pasteurianum]AJA47735.1 putative transposase InsQ for insertion sequence element IS609 [Clostridium pasteurianum DSM 525 = ATCC 6013]AJA51723.1 putative transposase InsQ for insertion sequence element IS609 [Clostridium pasteurianum DSM 525 = ATCC 6013]AOZ75035.1 transposase [Clostridium pasteurianum DSM 525 = ATCC 6013]AOZ78830.1 transposase [Clostridium pasteurianum]ELP59637.1 transposase, IS605 OrfB family protein [Clostridium past
MILANKVRVIPNIEQQQKLWQSVGTARFIYNWTLARQEENYKNGGKFINDGDLRKELTILKKSELNWLSGVSNNVAKQAVKDGCNAYKRFFKGLADKPRFKSRRKSKPSFYNDNIKLKVKANMVLIEKVGWVRTSEQLPMDVKYTNPRVSFDGKFWYISIGIEKEAPIIESTGISIGVDLGLKNLAIVSNIDNPFKNINKTKEVKRLKKKLKRKQKQVSRKYEKGKIQIVKEGENRYKFTKTYNIKKLEKEVKLIQRRLSNIRLNHIHQATTEIAKTKPSRIVVEDLNVKGMLKNKHLSKAIQEQCFYKFISILEYKSKFNGIEFVKADRFYPSSKTCSCCGEIKKDLKLKDRVFICPSCNNKIDRDKNASINLSRYKQSA